MTIARLSNPDEPGLALGSAERDEVILYRINRSGKLIRAGTIASQGILRSMIWNEGTSGPRLIMFSPQRERVSVTSFGEKPPDVLAIPRDADNLRYEDVTNDGLPDALLFGKRSAGIIMYRGSSKGFSSPAVSLLSDLSVSDAITSDLNGDKIRDLFISDWLSNRVVLYLGIGRGVFSEQVSVGVPGEPADLALYRDGPKRMRIAVTLPEQHQIHVFMVNALGEFKPETILPCPGKPGKVRFSDVDADGFMDLITATEKELVVYAGTGGRRFRGPALFAVDGKIIDWAVGDLDRDKLDDAAVLTEKPTKVILLGNSSFSGSVNWPTIYAVGRSPRGLTSADFNGDGLLDIGVVSSSPGSLCLLLNRGGGRMSGPFFSSVAADPVSVRSVVGGGDVPGATFVISHERSTQVTVVRKSGGNDYSSFSVPTAPNPFVMSARIDPAHNTLSFLARSGGDDRNGISISLFEEVTEDQFIETSLRPNPPRRVTSITSFDMTGDGKPDLLFSTSEKAKGETVLSISRGMDRFSFAPHERLFSFQDSVGSVRFIREALVDNDSWPDIVVVLGEPKHSILLLFGNQSGGIRDSVEWIRNVDVPGENAFVVQDLDNDGFRDFCFVDQIAQQIVAVYGTNGRGFLEKRSILPSSGVVALLAAPFSSPSVIDLVISNEITGTVSLISHPF